MCSLAIGSALLDQARHGIATLTPALVAGDLQHVELADQVALAGHIRPSFGVARAQSRFMSLILS